MSDIDLTGITASDGFAIEGDSLLDHTGYSLSIIGDVNGDGYDDVLIGAPGVGGDTGRIYLIYGKAAGFGTIDLSALTAADGVELTGKDAGDQVGWSVAGTDLNGDGNADMLVGAPGVNGDAGTVFVVYGGLPIAGNPFSTSNFLASYLHGAAAGDQLGYSVAAAGDVNGDGIADFVVGAPGGDSGGADSGQAYIIFGDGSSGMNVDVSTLTASQGFLIQGDAAGDGLGVSVSSAGDINGDGYDDIIVGANGNDSGGADAGAAYVIFGKASGFGTIDTGSLGANGFTITGDAGGDHLGISVASLGDINNDGYDDIIVGADANSGEGSAYVIFGKAGGFTNIDLTTFSASDGFSIHGAATSDQAGYSVSSAGDVNGDGYDDILVGVPGNDSGGSDAGAAYLIYGKASGFGNIDLSALTSTDGFKIQGDVAGDVAGSSVSGGGDINNDGYDDLVIGAYQSDGGGTDAGAAYVIFGHSTATGTTAPVAGDDALDGLHDQANNYAAVELLANDTDADSDPLAIQSVHNAVHGDVALNLDGSVTFTPDAGFVGEASFEYIVSDGNGGTNRGVVTVDVAANNAPVAADDALTSTAEETQVNFAATALLGNDTDPNNGDTLLIDSVSNPFGGTVVLNGDGSVTFNPATDFEGTASFDYVVSDGNGGTDSAHATFTVTGVEDAPTANDDSLLALQDTSVNYRADKILGNDTDPDVGTVLAIQSVSNPSNGTVTLETNGSVTFTPSAGFTGTAGFDYVLSDGNGGTDTAHATITVGSGFAPEATDDVVLGTEDTSTTYYWYDLLTNDSDADGDTLVLSDAFNAVGGTVVYNAADSSITFTPDPGYLGFASFDYEVSDGNGGTDTATAEVILLAIDHPPVAADDAFTTNESTPITTGNLLDDNGSGVDSDQDGDPLTIFDVNGNAGAVGTQIALASGALLTVNSDGTFDYDPNGAFDYLPTASSGASDTPGTDSFTYSLTGGGTATVTITLNGVDTNDLLIGTTAADTLSGGIGSDTIYGGDSGDLIDGGAGADDMYGELGNDTYIVDNTGDFVTESVGQGTDIVLSSVSYGINGYRADNVENLTLTGSASISGTGNGLVNILTGNSGNNILDGRGGADTMAGGLGDDTYVVDNAGDVVTESVGAGTDTVNTTISYTLADNVERLVLVSGSINGTGNALANFITGNSQANVLDGLGGADRMEGRGGDDTYIVNNIGDVVVEGAGGGTDTVFSSVTYAINGYLADNVENLTLTGGASINATGNGLANVLTGNSGTNILDGRGGDDTYVVNNSNDVVVEAAGGGTDTVLSSVSYAINGYRSDNVENLTLTGSASVNGIGNPLNNTITGNSGNNVLEGRFGDDVINGHGGNDTLVGGVGNDTFVFDTALGAGNVDSITDFAIGNDHVLLSASVFTTLTGSPTLDAAAFYTGSAAHDADDRIIYNSSTGDVYYDADGNGAGAQVLFAHVTAGMALSSADFLIGP